MPCSMLFQKRFHVPSLPSPGPDVEKIENANYVKRGAIIQSGFSALDWDQFGLDERNEESVCFGHDKNEIEKLFCSSWSFSSMENMERVNFSPLRSSRASFLASCTRVDGREWSSTGLIFLNCSVWWTFNRRNTNINNEVVTFKTKPVSNTASKFNFVVIYITRNL